MEKLGVKATMKDGQEVIYPGGVSTIQDASGAYSVLDHAGEPIAVLELRDLATSPELL